MTTAEFFHRFWEERLFVLAVRTPDPSVIFHESKTTHRAVNRVDQTSPLLPTLHTIQHTRFVEGKLDVTAGTWDARIASFQGGAIVEE